MKNLLSIFLAFTVLIASMSHTSIVVAFKVNQSDIIDKFCINKSAPEMHCDGKCFLSSRLAENEGDENNPSPFTQLEQSLKINFFSSQFISTDYIDDTTSAEQHFSVEELMTQLYLTSVLQPPECADQQSC